MKLQAVGHCVQCSGVEFYLVSCCYFTFIHIIDPKAWQCAELQQWVLANAVLLTAEQCFEEETGQQKGAHGPRKCD